jgi:hypothetical protein
MMRQAERRVKVGQGRNGSGHDGVQTTELRLGPAKAMQKHNARRVKQLFRS